MTPVTRRTLIGRGLLGAGAVAIPGSLVAAATAQAQERREHRSDRRPGAPHHPRAGGRAGLLPRRRGRRRLARMPRRSSRSSRSTPEDHATAFSEAMDQLLVDPPEADSDPDEYESLEDFDPAADEKDLLAFLIDLELGLIEAYEEDEPDLEDADLVRTAAQVAGSHAQALVALRLAGRRQGPADQAARSLDLSHRLGRRRLGLLGRLPWPPNPPSFESSRSSRLSTSRGWSPGSSATSGARLPDFDIVVIDDGSTDTTAAHAEAQGAVVIRHPFNLGIGGAMQSGYKYALRHGYDVAVQIDGDGQHKPEYLPDLLAALQTEGDEADMVTGSRFLGEPGYKVPLGRRAGNLIFAVVMSTITRRRDHRPHLRLSHDEPPRHRALRPRLPARLPRGRGDPDAPRAPPAPPRGARVDERARLRARARSTTRAAPTTW